MQDDAANLKKRNRADKQRSVISNFNTLPNEAFVRLPCVAGLLSVSGSQIWRMVKAKKLKSYKLSSRVTAFRVSDVRELLKGVA